MRSYLAEILCSIGAMLFVSGLIGMNFGSTNPGIIRLFGGVLLVFGTDLFGWSFFTAVTGTGLTVFGYLLLRRRNSH